MKLTIDRQTCMGHGLCYYTAPDLVTDDDRGFGQVVGDGYVADSQLDLAAQAESLCPERAVRLLDDNANVE